MLKSKSIQKTAIMIAVFTFLSQLLSLVRDRLFANQIGTGLILDSYYYAFKIPDILFAIFTSLVSVTVLIPLLVKYDKNGDHVSMKKVYNLLFSVFFIFSSLVILALLIFMPFAPIRWIFSAFIAAGIGFASARWMNSRLGGVNGDVLGASIVAAEIAALMVFAI